MSLETEFLGVKLNELEKAYEILVNSKNAKTNAEITENYNAVKMLIVNDEKDLKNMSDKPKLPFLAELTQIQLEYYTAMSDIYEKEIAINIISKEHNTEMSALFSEYMIDSAVYAARKALLSYLHTLFLVTKGGAE